MSENDGPLNGRLVQSPVLKMMVPKQSAGAIIGKAAANIKARGEKVLLAKRANLNLAFHRFTSSFFC